MDEEKKKMLKLGIFIIVMCLFAVGLFAWGFLAKGKLVFYGDTPFNVTVIGEETLICEDSPCEMSLSGGAKDVFITKTGYRDIYTEERVKTWRSTKVELEFRMEPTLTEAEELPGRPRPVNYEIRLDEEAGAQKLVDAEDERTIVYFQRPMSDPKIFGDERFVLVADRDIYKIDARHNKREEVKEIDLPNIEEVKWSLDGEYMLFTEEDSQYLQILDTRNGEINSLSLFADIHLADWIYDNRLTFLTNQEFGTTRGTDEDGYSYGELRDEVLEEGYSLGFYYPGSDRYSRVDNFREIKEDPENFTALANGTKVYFKVGEEKFKIILEKI